jgi:hypothetical protein
MRLVAGGEDRSWGRRTAERGGTRTGMGDWVSRVRRVMRRACGGLARGSGVPDVEPGEQGAGGV